MSILAPLLEYPDDNTLSILDSIVEFLEKACPEAAKKIAKFNHGISENNKDSLEELFTRTFDIAPLLCPYVTAHIYGDENFDRGRLMSTLASKFEEKGFVLKGELPDHISVILKFAPYLDEEELDELNDFCLAEPVKQMHQTLKEADSPYSLVFDALSTIMKSKFKQKSQDDKQGDRS